MITMNEIWIILISQCLVNAKHISIFIVIIKRHYHINVIITLGSGNTNLFICDIENVVMLAHQSASKQDFVVVGLISGKTEFLSIFLHIHIFRRKPFDLILTSITQLNMEIQDWISHQKFFTFKTPR